MFLSPIPRVYLYAYTRRDKEEWYYALKMAAIYHDQAARAEMIENANAFRKYMAGLAVCIRAPVECPSVLMCLCMCCSYVVREVCACAHACMCSLVVWQAPRTKKM